MKAVKNKEIKKDIYNMLIPMIFESILQTSAGLISTAMLGRLLADDVSAQGLALRISETLWCLYRGIAIGATILIARSIGKNDRNQCKHTTQQTILSAMPIAIISMILLLTFPTQILSFFSKETELLNKAVIFLKIAIWGFPSTVIMSAVTASFQGHGNTKTPMLLAGLLNIVNIITGYVFIFGFAFIPAMGIKGSAIALVLSQTVTALVGLILLFGKKGLYGGTDKVKFFIFDKKLLKEIYLIGIPAALESVFWQLSAMFLSKMILRYGSNAYASYQIGLQAEAITEMPAYGFGTAATTLIARAIGRGDGKSKKEYFKEMIKIGLIISSITSCLLIFFPGVFMNMMTEIEAIKPAGIMYVFIMGFVQIPQTLSRVYNGTIRAEGHKNAPMYITAIGIWGIRIPLCFLASSIFKWDLNFIWIFIALDQIVRFALSFLFHRYSGKKQLKNQQID